MIALLTAYKPLILLDFHRSFNDTRTTFDRVYENKSSFFVLIIWSIRTQADMPLFGFNRMTTDKGGLMELRVWFWGVFSVRDVHWQKWAEMSW